MNPLHAGFVALIPYKATKELHLSNFFLDRQSKNRRQHRVKLPDAAIWATGQRKNTLLITRNTRDFRESEPDIRIPYRL